MSPMSEDIHRYLTDPGNLEVALQLEDSVQTTRLRIFSEFWKRVRRLLLEELGNANITDKWHIPPLDENVDHASSCLWIIQRDKDESYFGVCAQSLTAKGKDCYFGISRGKPLGTSNLHSLDQELADALSRDGYKPQAWWSGWKYFSDAALPRFSIQDAGDVLQINRDNQEEGDIARQTAELMWNLFRQHRETLEELNRNYPYRGR